MVGGIRRFALLRRGSLRQLTFSRLLA